MSQWQKRIQNGCVGRETKKILAGLQNSSHVNWKVQLEFTGEQRLEIRHQDVLQKGPESMFRVWVTATK